MKKNIDAATDEFISAILDSEVYAAYRAELEKVKQETGLKEQLDTFRRRNYELQISLDNDFGKIDQFEREYEEFRANQLVSDFLAAELDLCRMMQRINTRIVAGLEFE